MLGPRRAFSLLLILPLTFCAKHEAGSTGSSDAPPPTTVKPAAIATTSSAPTPSLAATASALPAATPSSSAAGGVATADGEQSGVTVTIKELKRASGGIVNMKFSIVNASDKPVRFGYNFGDHDHEIRDFDSVGGVQMIDPVGKKKYFVARDSEGKCVCSQGVKDINAGSSTNLWAKFPAPPDDVQKISLVIPHFTPMDDVPISK